MDPLAVALGTRFISQKRAKAWQSRDGQYFTATSEPGGRGERVPLSMRDLDDHLAGRRSLGHYLIGDDDTCKLFAFDIDLTKTGTIVADFEEGLSPQPVECNPREVWLQNDPASPEHRTLRTQLRCLAHGLASMTHRLTECPVAVSYSGRKGLHVYCFTGKVPAQEAHEGAIMVLKAFGCFEPVKGNIFWAHVDRERGSYPNQEIEIFPKQGSLQGKDLGNLMRLPLGINAVTRQRSHFIWFGSRMDTFEEMDPMHALNGTLPWPMK